MTKLALYHAELSPCAHKVRIVLEEKGIPFESCIVNLMTKENLRPEYLKINPKGVVPAIIHGEDIITESTIICEYLEDRFDSLPLMPATALGKARVRAWLKLVDEYVHPNTMPILFGALARYSWLSKSDDERNHLLSKIPDPARRERQARIIEHGLDAPDVGPALTVWAQAFEKIERQVAQTDWLAGDAFTLADCALVPYIFIMKYLRVQWVFERYPNLDCWMRRCSARPSFDAAIRPYVSDERFAKMHAIAKDSSVEIGRRFQNLSY